MENFNFTNLAESDTMTIDEMLDILNMKRRIQQTKAMHPYEIHHTAKSGWFTNVDDITQPSGKRKIRRCNEASLWDALAEWYIDKANRNITLKELYQIWIDWRTTPNNASTIKRINASWKAYYIDEPLSQKILETPLVKITSLMLREWAESLMKIHTPDKKKFSRMFSIINQCYIYASDEDIAIVPDNVWQKARKKINNSLIVSNVTPSDESQVFTDEERRQLKIMVQEDLQKYKKQPTSAGLQILFLFETGLRIGECCGLKFSDIDWKQNRIYIRRQADNDGVKEKTKTSSSYRDIPLTREARRILKEVEAYNREHGFTAEWIFQSDNKNYDYRLSYNSASRKLTKLCRRLGTV